MQPELTELHSFIQIGMPSLVEHFVLGFVHVVELLPGATALAPHNSCSIGDKLVTFTTADISLQLEVERLQSGYYCVSGGLPLTPFAAHSVHLLLTEK